MTSPAAYDRVLAYFDQAPAPWPNANNMAMTADIQTLTQRERGAILAEVWGRGYSDTHKVYLGSIERGGDDDPRTIPLFSPDEASRALTAFADAQPQAEPAQEQRAFLTLRVICGTIGPLPPEGLAALARLFPLLKARSIYWAMIAARALGDDLALDAALAEIAAICGAGRDGDRDGAILFQEYEIVAKLQSASDMMRGLAEIQAGLAHDVPGLEPVLSDLPEWQAFGATVVEESLTRIRDITSGKAKYTPDKLMVVEMAWLVARIMKYALRGRTDWGLAALEELWFGAALAPDPKAKTAPSQSLAMQLGKVVVEEPQPEAVLILQKLMKQVRHGGIKKKLERAVKAASRNLALHPERVLDLLQKDEIPADFKKLFCPALKGLLCRIWQLDAQAWQGQMTNKALWPMTSPLIWDIRDGDGDFAALPQRAGKGLTWLLADGTTRPFDKTQHIRLWHPAEATTPDREAWQQVIASRNIAQPFAQAFREIYPIPQADEAGPSTQLFAGYPVAQIPLIGLAHRMGWRDRYSDNLILTLGGWKFEFIPGVHTWPGAGGEGETGAFSILGPEQRLMDVPPRILSEALRLTDLIVATGNAGVKDAPPNSKTSGQQSLMMRKCLLELMHPAAQFDGRWLLLQGDHRMHMGTGRLLCNGLPVDPPKSTRSKPTPRGPDPVMEKLLAAIDHFGLKI